MVGVLVVIGIVALLALGFYLTRGAGGPAPFDAEGRAADARTGVPPVREPNLRVGDELD
jgi:hypothetical protein